MSNIGPALGDLPLAGLRVVELSGGHSELSARLLADLGAEILLVEPPGGLSSRAREPWTESESLYFATRNVGKQSIVVDLKSAVGHEQVLVLLKSADILMDSLGAGGLAAAGLNPEALQALYPQLVIVSISDFGQTGPYAGFRGSNAVLAAMGGVLSRSGLPDRPPVIPPAELARETGAVQAVWCALLAYWNRLHLGLGDRLDFSLHEAVAQVIDPATSMTGKASTAGTLVTTSHGRPDEAHRYPIFPCSDGYVRICVMAPKQWHALRHWLGSPQDLMHSDLDKTVDRYAAWGRIGPRIATLFVSETAADLVAEAHSRGVPLEKVADVSDVLTDDHFAARGAFAPVSVAGATGLMPSGFFEMDTRRIGVHSTPPPADSDAEVRFHEIRRPDYTQSSDSVNDVADAHPRQRRPLSGLRVIDLGVIVAGGELGRLFASQGADVIKVENSRYIDADRTTALSGPMSPTAASRQRGKRSAGIDLRSKQGRLLLLKLVAQADLVLSNFKPGTLEKLGLDTATMAAVNPRLVVVDSSALGATGPRSSSMGYGPLVRAATSLTTQWRDPLLPDGFCDGVTIFPDHFVARVCAIGALSLLIRRQRTELGGSVSVSQAESILNIMPEVFLAASLTAQGSVVHWSEDQRDVVLACAGHDEWAVLTLHDSQGWAALSEFLVATGALDEHGGRDGLILTLREWAAELSPNEVMNRLQAAGLAAGAMIRPNEFARDPHLLTRNFIVQLEQPGLDAPLPVENAPCASMRIPDPELAPAPFMFTHTRDIAHDLLNLDGDEIEALVADGVLEVRSK